MSLCSCKLFQLYIVFPLRLPYPAVQGWLCVWTGLEWAVTLCVCVCTRVLHALWILVCVRSTVHGMLPFSQSIMYHGEYCQSHDADVNNKALSGLWRSEFWTSRCHITQMLWDGGMRVQVCTSELFHREDIYYHSALNGDVIWHRNPFSKACNRPLQLTKLGVKVSTIIKMKNLAVIGDLPPSLISLCCPRCSWDLSPPILFLHGSQRI